MTNHYKKLDTINVWARADEHNFEYSDGTQTENRILSELKRVADTSTISTEIINLISDWPSEYHFSRKRRNLFLPFSISKEHTILELGCGCGAITRHLGECGATVIAVDGSIKRAEIAAERCRDLDNVSIYCDNIDSFSFDQKFDYVTLIGVLEYSPQYIDAPDPVNHCLEIARNFLKPGGSLILAIENQFGLKYFNGCSEDHLNIPFFGIEDRYSSETPVTFGKHELNERLVRADYETIRFYYPFPDYKLPSLIISQEAIDSHELQLGDLLSTIESRDYSGNTAINFKDSLVWPALARNHLIDQFSNSFLVLASIEKVQYAPIEDPNFLAAAYATDRQACFATKTTFVSTPDGPLVTKKFINNVPQIEQHNIFGHRLVEVPYIRGNLLLAEFQKTAAKTSSLSVLSEILRPWIELLKANTLKLSPGMINGVFLDCIPRNIIHEPSGAVTAIDTEWFATGEIPLDWVVLRGIADCIFSSAMPEELHQNSTRSLIVSLCAACSIKLTDEAIENAIKMEESFQNWATIPNRKSGLKQCIDNQINIGGIRQLKHELNIWKMEVARIKGSASWNITKPIRLVQHMVKKLLISPGSGD